MVVSPSRRSLPSAAAPAGLPARWPVTRRRWIAAAAAGAAWAFHPAGPARPAPAAGSQAGAGGSRRFHVFSKHLQWLDAEPLAETAAAAGYGGIELTVRPGGHVEPERVATELPRFVAAARRQGLTVDMIVTAITAADEPRAEAVLRAAAAEGVGLYRLGYFGYEPERTIADCLDDLRRRAAALAELNRRCGIAGGYQNHHGTLVGGGVWDIQAVLAGVDPAWLGCQYDIRHAAAEATGSWEIAWRLVAPHVTSLALKDFRWDDRRQLHPVTVAAGAGLVPWTRFAAALRATPPHAPLATLPITAHCEFELFSADEARLDLAPRRRLAVERLRREGAFLADALAPALPAAATAAP